jgi:predicted lactoylglutathione lyase
MGAKKPFVNLPVKKLDKSKDFIPRRGWPYLSPNSRDCNTNERSLRSSALIGRPEKNF